MIGFFLSLVPAWGMAAIIQNTATASFQGVTLNGVNATVTLNVAAGTNAVNSVTGSLIPSAVPPSTSGVAFTLTLTPTIYPSDTGINQFTLTLPQGYSNLAIASVEVNGSGLTLQCSAPASGEYCGSVSGQTMTILLGAYVLTNNTPIVLNFTADTPAALGSGNVTASVDDTATLTPAQSVDFGNSNGQLSVVYGVDPIRSQVTADPVIVVADGVAAAQLGVVLYDSSVTAGAALNQTGTPVAGKQVVFSSSRGIVDDITQPAAHSDAYGFATGQIRSLLPGAVTITATDVSDGIVLNTRPLVYFTQGRVLDITKRANKREAVIGEVVTYDLTIRNISHKDVTQVNLEDRLPPNFKFVEGSLMLNGTAYPVTGVNRILALDLGTIPAWVDSNNNGVVDANEPGYMNFSYQLRVGAGAAPGEYINNAAAHDVCTQCLISNTALARVSVVMDPVFDLGTIIGKVFEDKNGDGHQDEDEPGVGGAMVVLDTGVYALTDEYGRYHFPAVQPGAHLVKINLQSLAAGAAATTDEAAIAEVGQGMLAKVNFGVSYHLDTETIGRRAEYGVNTESAVTEESAQLFGNAETLSAFINSGNLKLSIADVQLSSGKLDDTIEINNGAVTPLSFIVEAAMLEGVQDWALLINARDGTQVRSISGAGAPPAHIEWDARDQNGNLLDGGGVYDYQLTVQYLDGTYSSSARRLLGVNRSSDISLSFTGSAFKPGSAELSDTAQSNLDEAAEILRQYPEETILIEGHTDASGSSAKNRELSQARAQAAADYLVNNQGIAREKLVVRGYGSDMPVASNSMSEGRELNRRVEIKGLVGQMDRATLLDQYRVTPAASLNGQELEVDAKGHYQASIDSGSESKLELVMSDKQGRTVKMDVTVPGIEIVQPAGVLRLAFGAEDESQGYVVKDKAAEGEPVMSYQLIGRTDPGNEVQLNGQRLLVESNGKFTHPLSLSLGDNVFALAVRNSAGYTRLMDINVAVSDRDTNGDLLMTTRPIPYLSVKLPPEGVELTSPILVINGVTEPGNRLWINGQDVEVKADGQYTATTTLNLGDNTLEVRAVDPNGYEGSITRNIKVSDSKLFLLAFADGKLGQMQANGYIQGAGKQGNSGFYNEGRIAYYLKGVIAGKYLITSAFDSGRDELDKLFTSLDQNSEKKLLTNLDPDKFYPVYGDDSTLVYDVQSQAKFYLAVDSDTLNAVVGNYQTNLSDTELSAYQRTLFGGRVHYRSLARTREGRPDLEAVVFGADVRQTHVRDVLRGTGGSLYYLSQGAVIEGSEKVTLVVRDKNTGLTLSRMPQQQNGDYEIKYEEGRLFFSRPISSVLDDSRLVDSALLAGNPLYIEVEYETESDDMAKSAGGVRVRKQVSENLSLGGTYVQDELETGQYQLQGVDAELHLKNDTRVLAETAQSQGSNGESNVSDDGGLSYRTLNTDSSADFNGNAWKLAAETDLGAWLGNPGRYQASAYIKNTEPEFHASGNDVDQGMRKSGGNVSLKLTEQDTVRARIDRTEALGTNTSSIDSSIASLQAQHSADNWRVTGEYQDKSSGSNPELDNSHLAGRIEGKITEEIGTSLEHQLTLSGVNNDQTTLGISYQPWTMLMLDAKGTVGTLGHASQFGAQLDLAEQRLYMQQRLNSDSSGDTETTVAGAEHRLGKAGRLYSEYQWEHRENDERNLSVLGALHEWDVGTGMRFLLSGEHAAIDAVNDSDRYSLAAGLSYADPRGFRAATRNEWRRELGGSSRVQILTTNTLELKLDPDYTLLGKYRYSRTRDHANNLLEAEFDERSIGLAYRPVRSDRLNGLLRYTTISDQRPLQLTGGSAELIGKDVLSAEWTYDITRKLEWVDKLAYKIREESSIGRPTLRSTTWLMVHRLNYRIMRSFDLGAEYRVLRQEETSDQREGFLTEAAWRLQDHMRLGVGFNFTDFSDDEFSDNNYSVYGWYLRMQGYY